MIKSIIFDFDGVILESAIIKTEAFAEVVSDYPKDKADEFVAYHMSHMGISRHVKFQYFIENILNETYTNEKEKVLADNFEKIVYDRVMNCSFVPGAEQFLEENYKKYDFFIASGTPEEEMNRIIDGRELRRFFKGVYGTPMKKAEIIRKILRQSGYSKNDVVFVGDAGTDLNAANEIGLVFIGRNTTENKDVFENVKHKVDNLMQIESIIKEFSES